MPQTSIWIDEGCIQCFWCQNLEAGIFAISADGCEIRSEVRSDHLTDPNRSGHARLKRGVVTAENIGFMRFIADGCPTHVIHIATTLSESPI